MKSVLLFVIRLYQKKSFLFFNRNVTHCRFYPSCSEYAYQSIQRYGTIKGSFLALTRVLRCHPLSKGGLDPVR